MIKIFKENNDKVINYFLKHSKGKIVNYNPIIVEYDDKNNVKDPYDNYIALTINTIVTYIHFGDFYIDKYGSKNDKYTAKSKVDTILFPLNKDSSKVKFMIDGIILFNDPENYYFSIDPKNYKKELLEKHVLNAGPPGANYSYKLEFNDNYDANGFRITDFNLYDMLIEAGERQLNYTF